MKKATAVQRRQRLARIRSLAQVLNPAMFNMNDVVFAKEEIGTRICCLGCHYEKIFGVGFNDLENFLGITTEEFSNTFMGSWSYEFAGVSGIQRVCRELDELIKKYEKKGTK